MQPPKCNSCSSNCHPAPLAKLGARIRQYDFTVALAGNPNTGKSTIFNALTGLRQHVGNWAGKTVSRAEGAFQHVGKKFKLVDLPGTYSLLSTSIDEEIARDFILFGKPDVTVVVTDATRLERSLHLVLQILEVTNRVVVALNLTDEAERNGLTIETPQLSRELGVPIVPMAARRMVGIDELLSTISQTAQEKAVVRPSPMRFVDAELESAIGILAAKLEEQFEDLPNARWIALRLLEGDESIINAVRKNALGTVKNENHLPDLALAEAR